MGCGIIPTSGDVVVLMWSFRGRDNSRNMNELEQLRQEAEHLKTVIKVRKLWLNNWKRFPQSWIADLQTSRGSAGVVIL